MDGGVTISGSLGQSFLNIGAVVFKWLPATIFTFIGTPGTSGPSIFNELSSVQTTMPVTTGDVATFLQNYSVPGEYTQIYHWWTVYVAFSTLFSFSFAALIIYCAIRIRQIRHYERLKFAAAAHPVASADIPKTRLRWNRIIEQSRSDDEQQWRLAILEADIMLNELLDAKGYKGETMGDKMRQVERADWNTIDIAWEAHRMRNKVAHEGMGASLDAREIKRIIGLYERVFQEFNFVE